MFNLRSKIKYLLIYIVTLAVLALIPLSLANRGGVSKTADNATYLYLPSEYTPGYWVAFKDIRSDNCDGAELVYYKSGGIFHENRTGEYAYQAAASLRELKMKLFAGYNSEGQLSAAAYCAECSDRDKELFGHNSTVYYLLFRFHDNDGESYEDILDMCAGSFAQNTAKTLEYNNSGEMISRLFVTYEYNSVDKNHVEIYISSENASPEELNTAPEKFEKVRLYPFDGIDDFTLLKAFNQSSEKEPAEGTRRIAERTAEILSESFMGELAENLSLTDDFEITVCEGKLDELS